MYIVLDKTRERTNRQEDILITSSQTNDWRWLRKLYAKDKSMLYYFRQIESISGWRSRRGYVEVFRG